MITLISLLLLLSAVVFFYLKQEKFGLSPSEKRKEAFKQSPHYRDGKFHNLSVTPTLTEGYSMTGLLYDQLFKKFPRRRPVDSLPSVKTSLQELADNAEVLVWFGHSSYFIKTGGKTFLIDPVFSGNASPIPGTNVSFKGSDIYRAEDMPAIDYLLITHDHYDHLDYETVIALRPKVGTVVCGLGVGSHFERWGYAPSTVIEKDWYQHIDLGNGQLLHTAPARHFSGRGFVRNNTLWLSFILQSSGRTLYLGGDSGYDSHFAAIGEKFGPIDLALLDNGQYNIAWQAIHMLPEEVLKAAGELRTKRLFPVHSSKFMLAQHPWDEPLNKISTLNQSINLPLVTPKIGEIVRLDDPDQKFEAWWKGLH